MRRGRWCSRACCLDRGVGGAPEPADLTVMAGSSAGATLVDASTQTGAVNSKRTVVNPSIALPLPSSSRLICHRCSQPFSHEGIPCRWCSTRFCSDLCESDHYNEECGPDKTEVGGAPEPADLTERQASASSAASSSTTKRCARCGRDIVGRSFICRRCYVHCCGPTCEQFHFQEDHAPLTPIPKRIPASYSPKKPRVHRDTEDEHRDGPE